MRVKIGPYVDRWTSEIHTRYMNKKYGYDWEDNVTKFEAFLEKVEDWLQSFYNYTINLYLDKKTRKISVKIDHWDTWSMDHTLSYIIVPMLKQLNETKHGAPFIDDEDVPDELKSTAAPEKENDYDLDDNHFKRWDYVLDEMIWAFEQKARPDGWEGDFYEYDRIEPIEDSDSFSERIGIKLVWEDPEGRDAHQKRMSNGFRLFGKYFEHLWT